MQNEDNINLPQGSFLTFHICQKNCEARDGVCYTE